jgi:hypothetical protein
MSLIGGPNNPNNNNQANHQVREHRRTTLPSYVTRLKMPVHGNLPQFPNRISRRQGVKPESNSGTNSVKAVQFPPTSLASQNTDAPKHLPEIEAKEINTANKAEDRSNTKQGNQQKSHYVNFVNEEDRKALESAKASLPTSTTPQSTDTSKHAPESEHQESNLAIKPEDNSDTKKVSQQTSHYVLDFHKVREAVKNAKTTQISPTSTTPKTSSNNGKHATVYVVLPTQSTTLTSDQKLQPADGSHVKVFKL